MFRATTVIVGLALCLVTGAGMAQQPPPAQSADEEEQMDDALRKMGYVSGQACQCQTQLADKTRVERQSLDIANGILRLFGSDRAFTYAAAFGAGINGDLGQKKCPEVLKEYESMLGKLKVLAAR
jgi:hypothetical protein